MSKKSETITIGLLTALIAFAAITALVVAAGPGTGVTTSAHAMISSNIGGHDDVNNWKPTQTFFLFYHYFNGLTFSSASPVLFAND